MNSDVIQYPAFVSHSALGLQDHLGRLTVQAAGLLFSSEVANFGLPLDRLEVEVLEAERIQFTDPEQPELRLVCTSGAILENYHLNHHPDLRLQIRALRQQIEGRRSLKLAIILPLVFLGLVTMAFFGWFGLAGFLVRQVPVSWESGLSQTALQAMRAEFMFVERPQYQARLQSIADRLASGLPRNPYRFEFSLIDDPSPNAFALPGGRICVSTGLFTTAEKSEEIAAVLAHEMAHVIQRHGLKKLIQTRGPFLVLGVFIGEREGLLTLLKESSQLLLHQSYSRSMEREADELSWHYLVKANIDPRGSITFFRRLAAGTAGSQKSRGTAEKTSVFSSHPATAERIQHLETLWQRTPRKSGFAPLGVDRFTFYGPTTCQPSLLGFNGKYSPVCRWVPSINQMAMVVPLSKTRSTWPSPLYTKGQVICLGPLAARGRKWFKGMVFRWLHPLARICPRLIAFPCPSGTSPGGSGRVNALSSSRVNR